MLKFYYKLLRHHSTIQLKLLTKYFKKLSKRSSYFGQATDCWPKVFKRNNWLTALQINWIVSIWWQLSLHEKCPNREFFLVCIFLYSDWIRSAWSVFSCIRTEFGDLLRQSLYSVRIQENTDQKKLRIWTFFMQCLAFNELTHLKQLISFYTSWKHKETFSFLKFSWDIEKDQ